MAPLKIVQWTTGNVGKRAVRGVLQHPDLELVGCYAWSDDKAGRDVAELCGLDTPTGVIATNDVDALFALAPDAVIYTPQWYSVDDIVRILEAGINVISTAAFINGRAYAERERIVAACEKGGVSIFGSGISPGFIDLFAITAAGICDRIDKITVNEASNTTMYDSPTTEIPAGFGRHIDDPELPGMAAKGTAVFEEAVALIADAINVELDEIVCVDEYAQTTEDVVMDSWTIKAGHVAGVAASWQGRIGDRTVVELNVRWAKGFTLDPPWQIDEGHNIVIDGLPTVKLKVDYLPPPDFQATSFADFMVIGMVMTAMPAVNAVPYVVAAPPGIVTYNDLPMILPRGATVL